MAQAYDLFNEVKLSLGEDNPIMEAPPLIKVQFKRSDRSLKGDELLRARPITSAPVLTLPIPSIRVRGSTLVHIMPYRAGSSAQAGYARSSTSARNFSASMAAIQPVPAAVIACR